jgi:sodium/hydrogen antiporter
MSQLNLALAAVGILVLALGLLSGLIKRTPLVSAPIASLLLGVILGPAVLGWLDPAQWTDDLQHLVQEAARITIGIAVMGVALRLPSGYLGKHWRTMGPVLFLLMPAMWLATSLLVHLILGLDLWLSLLVGAVLTPTDPVVSATIVLGKIAERNLPHRLRNAISAESGANDGLAFPLVLLPILVLTHPGANVAGEWLLNGLMWETGGALLFGAILGYLLGQLLHLAERKGTIEQSSFLAYTLAITVFTLGSAEMIGVNSLIAVFAAGIAFDHVVKGQERMEEEKVQEAANQFFTLPIFALLGLVMPWQEWLRLGAPGIVLALAVLMLRRLPALMLMHSFIPEYKGRREAAFAGWFGPLGAAALFYAAYAHEHTGLAEPWVIGTLVITASILIHGATGTTFTIWYGRARLRAEHEAEEPVEGGAKMSKT